MKCDIYNCQRPVTNVCIVRSLFYQDAYAAIPYCADHVEWHRQSKRKCEKILSLEEYEVFKIKERL